MALLINHGDIIKAVEKRKLYTVKEKFKDYINIKKGVHIITMEEYLTI